MHLQSLGTVLLRESTAVLKAAIQMYNGELSEPEYVWDYNEARRVRLRNTGKSMEFVLRQAGFFRHFILLGVYGTRYSLHMVQTALRLPFIFLYYLSFPLLQSQI